MVRFLLLFLLVFISVSYSLEFDKAKNSAISESCDATAKILVKCMMADECNKVVSDLQISLSRLNVLSYLEKERFVSYCMTECKKGKLFKGKSNMILQQAIVNEYYAIYSRCVEVLSPMAPSHE